MDPYDSRRSALFDRVPPDVEAVVVPPGPTLRYLSGHVFAQDAHGRDSPFMLVLTPDAQPAILLPELATGRALDSFDTPALYAYDESPSSAREAFDDLASDRDLTGRVGVEYRSIRLLEASLVESVAADVVDVGTEIYDLRSRKDAGEVEVLRTAAAITDEVLEETVASIEPGMTESDVEALLASAAVESEAEGLGVSVAIAGERTAQIYPDPADGEIEAGDPVIIDTGVVYEGYYTDVTRTVGVGGLDDGLRDVYGVVRRAARAARDAVRPGISCHDLDRVARGIIEDAGYGDAFVTSLGHGFGLEPHEPPSVAPNEEPVLEVGNALTIEPGIYLDGVGGIRIEDDVVVTGDGVDVLTSAPRELRIVG